MMTDSASSWIVLAHLLRPQGRKGELLAELLTDFPERFEEQRRVFLDAPN
jgi:16S rRNA processing protein RimM